MTLALNLQIILKDDKWNKLGECFETPTHFHKCAKMKHNIFKWNPILEVGVYGVSIFGTSYKVPKGWFDFWSLKHLIERSNYFQLMCVI